MSSNGQSADGNNENARRYLAELRRRVREGTADENTPWLDLDVEAYRAYREGRTAKFPGPYGHGPITDLMMAGVAGKRVLCLAGGGGQQSAVYSLLGAQVTVFDLSQEQLEADQRAAEHYGYTVETIQGNMRDLAALPEKHFDRVYQPLSTLYIPDLTELYPGVARILRPGCTYFSQYLAPLLVLAEYRPWDGTGYELRVTEPYKRGEMFETDRNTMSLSEGRAVGEFHHLLSDILNGLIAAGLRIRGVWEVPRPGSGRPLEELTPGSDAHRKQFLPWGLSVVASAD